MRIVHGVRVMNDGIDRGRNRGVYEVKETERESIEFCWHFAHIAKRAKNAFKADWRSKKFSLSLKYSRTRNSLAYETNR